VNLRCVVILIFVFEIQVNMNGAGWADNVAIATGSGSSPFVVLVRVGYWCVFFFSGTILLLNLLLAIIVEAFSVTAHAVSSFEVELPESVETAEVKSDSSQPRQPPQIKRRSSLVRIEKRAGNWKRELHSKDESSLEEQPEDTRMLAEEKLMKSRKSPGDKTGSSPGRPAMAAVHAALFVAKLKAKSKKDT
jgi:hypothetical protein